MPLAVAVLVLVAANVLDDRVDPGLSLPVNVAAVALLLLLARWDGLTAVDVGLGRGRVGRGLRWAGAGAGIVLAVYLVALLVPSGREAFLDQRANLSVRSGLYQALLHVPLSTVMVEEVAFRGVLLAMAARRWGTRAAVLSSSLLFGLWHVLPSAAAARANPVIERVIGSGGAALTVWAVIAVAGTAAAGTGFCWLRLRSGSLLAPAGLHWATNGLGFLGALVARGLLAG